jgi:hypothetical protein
MKGDIVWRVQVIREVNNLFLEEEQLMPADMREKIKQL